MSKRPSNLKAGFFNYSVDFIVPSFGGEHGETDRENKTIHIYDRGSEELNRETLLHEILHVAHDDAFVFEGEHADEAEERSIRILSPKLMQYFRDNPELTKYLFLDEPEEEGEPNE
jgi:hypothetical protein